MIKKTLISALFLFSSFELKEEPMSRPFFQGVYDVLSHANKFEFYGFEVNLKQRRVIYQRYSTLHFLFRQDHNGKPLYWLTYRFNPQDSEEYFKRSVRTLQSGSVKFIK